MVAKQGDVLLDPGGTRLRALQGLQAVNEGVALPAGERVEEGSGLRLPGQRGGQIGGYLGGALAGVGPLPPAVSLRGVDPPQARLLHPSFRDQLLASCAVALRPRAVATPGG